jgi:hypothetical protein
MGIGQAQSGQSADSERVASLNRALICSIAALHGDEFAAMPILSFACLELFCAGQKTRGWLVSRRDFARLRRQTPAG